MEGGTTALEIIVGEHKVDEKDIRHYCKKWSEKTCGVWKWTEGGTFEEQWCQKMRSRLTIWGGQKQGQKAKEKLIRQERTVGWFEGEGKDRRERERGLRKQAKVAEREKEEKREEEMTKKIQETLRREKAMIEKESESEVEGIAPPCEKQRELEQLLPYNPQFRPPIKPRRCVPAAGIYMMKETEDEDDEAWKEEMENGNPGDV